MSTLTVLRGNQNEVKLQNQGKSLFVELESVPQCLLTRVE